MFSCSPAIWQYLSYSSSFTMSFSTSTMLFLYQAPSFIWKKRWFQCFIANFKQLHWTQNELFPHRHQMYPGPTINIHSNPYCVQWLAINFWSIMLVVCSAFLTQKSSLFSSKWSRICLLFTTDVQNYNFLIKLTILYKNHSVKSESS